jgi:small subunit ribosomal protein S5
MTEEKINIAEDKPIEETVTEKLIAETETKEEAQAKKDKEETIQKLEEKDKEEIQKEKPKRLSRQEEEEAIRRENWEPKTKIGKDVKSGKIKNIDEILDANKKILEQEITESLIPVKTDLISMGQAKGKFGGGKRRAWRQTQRITKEGGRLTFSAMAIVGDEKGHVGIGVGKANETLPARDKATRKAKLNIIKVKRSCSAFDCSCDEPHTVPFEVEGKSGSVRIKLIPAPQGTGLVVANELKKVMKMAGIKDVYSKTYGQVRTTFNLIKACMDALEKTNRK